MRAGAFSLEGPAGAIECSLKLPEGPPRLAALVCHPHPLYGGTMHSRVVYRVAAALAGSAGAAALRFNFRGVGLSAGSHDEGRGERVDARHVLEALATAFPGLPLLVAGYSFGAWVALHAGAERSGVAGLAGIGLATRVHRFEALAQVATPRLVVQGDRDPFGPIEDVRAIVASWQEPRTLVELPGADHFFEAAMASLEESVVRFANGLS